MKNEYDLIDRNKLCFDNSFYFVNCELLNILI